MEGGQSGTFDDSMVQRSLVDYKKVYKGSDRGGVGAHGHW